MSALCSQASCGNCGRCTAAYERDDSDDDYFEYAAEVATAEGQRVLQEVSEASDEETEPPF